MTETNLYDPLIRTAADKYRLPFYLIKAQILAESGFNPKAVSPCGAKGLMQLMPETAKEMTTVDHGPQTADLFDPETNIELGVKYDRWIFDHFQEISNKDERMKFMLAAYNCY